MHFARLTTLSILRHLHLQISCRIFLWDYDSKIVISGERLEVAPWHRTVFPDHVSLLTFCCRCFTDIDGTITKSDVLGHAAALVGTDWTHTGVASLFSDVYRNGYRFLYLSSRSISQAVGTRGTLLQYRNESESERVGRPPWHTSLGQGRLKERGKLYDPVSMAQTQFCGPAPAHCLFPLQTTSGIYDRATIIRFPTAPFCSRPPRFFKACTARSSFASRRSSRLRA